VPEPLAARLGPLLGRAHDAHHRMVSEALAALGLAPKAVGALIVLDAEGPLPQQRVAERQGIDRTTMVAVMDQLERLGAVERRRDERDRRAYAVHITRRGRRLLKQATDVIRAAEEEFLAPLAQTEQRRLRAALRKVVESAQR
jgi:DNA-binding MarR family transcriptional regulator